MLTPEQILTDLQSDRVKKVIIDSDMSAEIDDQFALAYCLGSDKIELLSVNIAHVVDPARFSTHKESIEKGYNEALKVFDEFGIPHDKYPVYCGSCTTISEDKQFAPQDSPAARNIINTVKNTDEIVYILVTGPCTSVVSAYMLDPTIKNNMCVIWLGGHCIDLPDYYISECNLDADYAAGQLLLNLDIPLLLLPCHGRGTINIVMRYDDFKQINSTLFSQTYPIYHMKNDDYRDIKKIMCDLAAPATIALNSSMSYRIVTAPVITDNRRYAWDSTRKKIIYMEDPISDMIVEDTIKSINNISNKQRGK